MQTRPPHCIRGSRAGMSLIEVMIALMVVTVSTYILTSTVTASAANTSAKREKAQAAEAVSNVIERIRACPPQDVYALFNADRSDDPYGAGTGFGPYFDVEGLDPQLDARGRPMPIGEVLLPGMRGVLDESFNQPEFGLPRDLDGSMFIESGNCADRYVILPIIVRVSWKGRLGERTFQMATVAVDRPLGEKP